MLLPKEWLRQHVYNVLLWTPGKVDSKKAESKGVVEVSIGEIGVSFLSTDGYVVVSTGSPEQGTRFAVRGEDLRKVHTHLDNPEIPDSVDVDLDSSHVYFGTAACDLVERPELYDSARAFISPGQQDPPDLERDFASFYLDPRRVSKFSLLEPKGDFPLAFRPIELLTGKPAFAWKYGLNAGGVMAPLELELMGDYPEGSLW